ncbi:MAG: OmpH family outer membrane protein [Planctomycetes bacterium]|nr:OmpH family outer membrane protein [Planctomycetota bacterium]
MKMDKWIFALVGLAGLAGGLLVCGGSAASSEVCLKIAVVDLGRVVAESAVCQAKAVKFKKTIEADISKLDGKMKEVKALEAEIAMLDPDSTAAAEKRRLIAEKRATASAESSLLKMETQEKYAAAMVEVYRNIMSAVDKCREREGVDIVLRRTTFGFGSAPATKVIRQLAASATLSCKKSMDITDKVIALIDKAAEQTKEKK